MQSQTRKVYACLAGTCRLQFWQNGRDPLRATAVTGVGGRRGGGGLGGGRGWGGGERVSK